MNEYLVALRAYQRGLVMHQLKYLNKIRPMDEIEGIDTPQKVDAKELSLGKTLEITSQSKSLILDSILIRMPRS
jgi:non-homologous end joining protein Ku